MKNKDYRLRSQLYQLRQMQSNGKKEVIWKLSVAQLDLLEKYFPIEVASYFIRTKQFQYIYSIQSSLLKDIHYANKKGKKTIVRRLSNDQIELLKDRGITVRPCQYRIILNE